MAMVTFDLTFEVETAPPAALRVTRMFLSCSQHAAYVHSG